MSDDTATPTTPVTVTFDPFATSGEMLDEVSHLQSMFHLLTQQEYQPSQELPCILHIITDEAVKEVRQTYPLQPLDSPLFENALYYEKKYLPQLEVDIRDYFQLPQTRHLIVEDDYVPTRYAPRPTMAQANERYKDTFFPIHLTLLQDFKIYDVLEAYLKDLLHYHDTSIQCYEETLALIMALATKVRAKYPNNKNAAQFSPEFEQGHKDRIKTYQENLLVRLLQDKKQRECMSCITLFQKVRELKMWIQYRGAELLYLPTHIRYLEKELVA